MRLLLSLAVLSALAAPASAGLSNVFSSTSLFQATAAVDPLDVSPADFTLDWGSAFHFELEHLTPASVNGTHAITAATAGDFGIDWPALHAAVDNPLVGGNTTVTSSLSTPLGVLTQVCCSASQFNRPNPDLSHVQYMVTRWNASPNPGIPGNEGIFVRVEVSVWVTTFAVPEPASAWLACWAFGLALIRHRLFT